MLPPPAHPPAPDPSAAPHHPADALAAFLTQGTPEQLIEYSQALANALQAHQIPAPTLHQPIDPALAALLQQQAQNQQNVQAQLLAALDRIAAVAPPPATQDYSLKPSPPETFGGKKEKLRDWITTIKVHLAGTRFARVAEIEKVTYIASFLRAAPQSFFNNAFSLSPRPPFLDSAEALLTELDRTFGDPDAQGKATRKLLRLKQGNRSVTDYAIEFQATAALAPLFTQDTLLPIFTEGLSTEMLLALASQEEPTDLTSLINLTIRLDNRLRNANNEAQARAKLSPSTPRPSASSHKEIPMELDSTNIRKGPLTDAEREYRRKNDLCMYCGGGGHYRRDCKELKEKAKKLSVSQVSSDREIESLSSYTATSHSFSLEDHLVVPLRIQLSSSNSVRTFALIDSGSMTNAIDASFAQRNAIPLVSKSQQRTVEGADGKPLAHSRITQETAPLLVSIKSHHESLSLDVTQLGHYPIILGIGWLKIHNPSFDWTRHILTFDSPRCAPHGSSRQEPVHGIPRPPSRHFQLTSTHYFKDHSAATIPLRPSPPSPAPVDTHVPPLTPPETPPATSATAKAPIRLFHKYEDFRKSLDKDESITIFAIDIIASPPSTPSPVPPTLPPEYHDFADVFDKRNADKLPPHRPYDHEIRLEPGTKPPFGPIYSLSERELDELSTYIKDNIAKGFIQPSTSPAALPILFVKKKDGSLRLCVDYRAINKITIKNRYPLPLITESLDRLKTAKSYSKIDLRGAYNLLRIAKGDEWKTAFRTRYGLYEYLVMPFGLTNAPATFQNLMNDVLRPFLDKFVIVYLDDILIFSETPEEHTDHVRQVLQKLRDTELFAKAEKCEFGKSEVEFLGYVVSPGGVRMDPKKVEAVTDWPVPRSVKELQTFLGFINFYRRFIWNFAKTAAPLTNLLRQNVPFRIDSTALAAFDALKESFTSAPVLAHFQPDRQTFIETDASDFAIAAVVSQKDDTGTLRPIAFFARKLQPAELNYGIGEKELLAIVAAIKHWRPYLEGRIPFVVFSDHRNLVDFTTTKVLSRRQARWAQILAAHHLEIVVRPGSAQGKSDALSRRPDFAVGSKASDATPTSLINPARLTVLSATTFVLPNALKRKITSALSLDSSVSEQLQYLSDIDLPQPPDVQTSLAGYSLVDDLLHFNDKIYIPDNDNLKLEILRENHDSIVGGHWGQAKTLERVARNYYWPGMRAFVNEYVRTCDACERAKGPRHKRHGELQPLPVPSQPWESIAMDFVIKLPPTPDNFDSILVVVDRFSKMAHFIPMHETDTAEEVANLFLENIFRLHGFPQDIVSDRGSVFTSRFWQHLMRRLDVKPNLSTAFHPQSDGQTERTNQILEQYLRIYCNYRQTDWKSLLPLAEFSYNDSHQSSLKSSPFFPNYAFHPKFTITQQPADPLPNASSELVKDLKSLHRHLKINLTSAVESMKKFYDRKVSPAPEFIVDDKVWLTRRFIKTKRPSDKLDHKKLGPFAVVEKIGGSAYRLDLPHQMKLHNVFHVSLLEPYHANTLPHRVQPPPPPVIVDDEIEYEVKEILDSRIHFGRLEYFVDWTGYDASHREWVPAGNVQGAQELVDQFHQKFPSRPAPPAPSHKDPPRRSSRLAPAHATDSG